VRVAAEVVWVGGAHVPAANTRMVGQAVRAWVTVLRCAMARADGEGGLRWPELMVVAACMLVWAPCQALMWVVVLCRQT
jgi:hypothetical protein